MFNKTLITALACASLTLGGCAGAAALAIEDGLALHDSAKKYVAAVHEARREVRRVCWEMLMKEVDAMEDAGNYAGARALLMENYPALVSISAVKQALDEDQVLGEMPFGCEGLE